MLIIPIAQGSAFFQQRVELEGVAYTLDFAWNARAGEWAMAVYSDEGVLALAGIALVTNRPILRRFHHLAVPPGELLFVDQTGALNAPGFADLSELWYFTKRSGMPDTTLDKRKLRVQIDTIAIEGVQSPGLRVSCKATKTLKSEPNKCDVTVYNLSPEHRGALTKIARPSVSVTAGYEGQLTQIFRGQALHVRHERRGPDVVTTITNSDSGDKAQKARVHKSFGPGAKPGEVLKELTKALGVKVGNLDTAVRKLNAGKAVSIYTEGCNLDGHAPAYLSDLCRSAGLEWSIQDGALQILDVGKSLAAQAIVLNESLLIGTPSVTSKSVVECTTFIQGDILPGRQIHVKHPFVTTIARIEKCEFVLDTYADDWYVSIEAQGAKK